MEGRYNDPEARRAREATRRLLREFGDPNRGDYRDPYTVHRVQSTEQVLDVQGTQMSNQNNREK